MSQSTQSSQFAKAKKPSTSEDEDEDEDEWSSSGDESEEAASSDFDSDDSEDKPAFDWSFDPNRVFAASADLPMGTYVGYGQPVCHGVIVGISRDRTRYSVRVGGTGMVREVARNQVSTGPYRGARPAPPPNCAAEQLAYEMIPLTADTYDFWLNYVCAMRLLMYQEPSLEKLRDGYAGAVKGFVDALEASRNAQLPQVWIAVASRRSWFEVRTLAEYAVQIEMCMTVNTSASAPFTTHMGIFATPLRALQELTCRQLALHQRRLYGAGMIADECLVSGNNLMRVQRLSTTLHAFAAAMICNVFPEKLYMITAPLRVMKNLIVRAFGAHAITKVELSGTMVLQVGADKPLQLPATVGKTDPWMFELTDLRGPRPKVAIRLVIMASTLPAHIKAKLIKRGLLKPY